LMPDRDRARTSGDHPIFAHMNAHIEGVSLERFIADGLHRQLAKFESCQLKAVFDANLEGESQQAVEDEVGFGGGPCGGDIAMLIGDILVESPQLSEHELVAKLPLVSEAAVHEAKRKMLACGAVVPTIGAEGDDHNQRIHVNI